MLNYVLSLFNLSDQKIELYILPMFGSDVTTPWLELRQAFYDSIYADCAGQFEHSDAIKLK